MRQEGVAYKFGILPQNRTSEKGMSLMQQIAELGDKVSYLEEADSIHSEAEQDLGEEDNRLSQFISLIQGLISVGNALFFGRKAVLL